MSTIWQFLPEDKRAFEFANKYNLDYRAANILINRGFNTEEKIVKFLNPNFNSLYDPYLLKDMDTAVNRIEKAKELNENIFIIGDYDVDGLTASTFLTKALRLLGINCSYFIPHRLEHGYGIKADDIEKVEKSKSTLVITVDNGIKAFEFAEELNKKNIDLIITDHHVPAKKLPKAFCIINPKLKDSGYPFSELSGIGTAFKVIQALYNKLKKEKYLPSLLKWVAIGTVADVVPLIDENRILVSEGFKSLSMSSEAGLKALMKIAGVDKKNITAEDIAFRIGPRINVAGRLKDPNLIMEMFFSDERNAFEIARKLNKLNFKRQRIGEIILKQTKKIIEKKKLYDDPIIVVDSKKWHRGVIGVIAARLVKKYNKPIILIAVEKDGKGYGSGRSGGDVSLLDKISKFRETFELKNGKVNFGGHSKAVGFIIEQQKIELLRNQIREKINPETTTIKKKYDVEGLIDIFKLNKKFFCSLNKLEPFGYGNPKPVFASLNVNLKIRSNNKRNKRISVEFTNGTKTIKGYCWRRQNLKIKSGKKNILFIPKITKYGNINLEIIDIK